MDTLDRYLIKELVVYFLLILIGLSTLFLAIEFLTKFWNDSLPLPTVLLIYALKIPEILRQFVPVACLMSTLLVLTTMSKQNEVIALYASGISGLRIAYTFLSAVAIISTISFSVFDPLIPNLEKKRQLLEKGVDINEITLQSFNKTGFWYRSGQSIYHVNLFNPAQNTLEEINLFVLNSSGGLTQKLGAQRARFKDNDWTLENVAVTRFSEGQFPKTEHYAELRGLIPEKPSDYRSLEVQPETMRLKELRKYISKNRGYGLDMTRQQVSYHERLSFVFTPIILVLLGIAFALKPLKTQSIPKGVAFCSLVVFIYLVLYRLMVSMGKGGFLSPPVAGWAPNFIFLGVASLLLWKRIERV